MARGFAIVFPEPLRRPNRPALRIGEVEIDRTSQLVTVQRRPLNLTPKEFALFDELAEQLGRAVRYTRLARVLWGSQQSRWSTRAMQIHVSRIRTKLGSALQLTTLRGWGYRLDAPTAP